MPIYEYHCPSCGKRFEQRRPMSQAGESATCPSCSTTAPRAMSRVARVSRGGADEGVEDDSPPAPPPMGGHGHSHGPMGHGH